MNTYEMIINEFQADEPIFVDDIKKLFPDKSRPWIDKTIKTMIDLKLMKRYDQGVYYILRKTAFGDSILNPNKVLTKKYIKNESAVYGYTSGMTLLNSVGLTTQVPNTLTIVSNNESSRGRKIVIGNQHAYLMRPPCEITSENYVTLQFLEAMKLVDVKSLDETENANLIKYIKNNKIVRGEIYKYCNYFPDYVSKRILGGGLIEAFAR